MACLEFAARLVALARNYFLPATLVLLGCAASAPAWIETGAQPPSRKGDDGQCPARTRWLASDPHVPLAVSKAGEILDVGSACCAAFAERGQRRRAVDFWGRIVGVAEVAGGRGNEATQCYELTLRRLEGAKGSLYVSPDFRGSPSFAWVPSPSEQDSLRELVAHADALLAADDEADPPLEWQARTKFFTAPPDASGAGPGRFAVVGGRALLLGRLKGARRWGVSYLDAEMHAAGFAPSNAYLPVAILDMTGDGYPEIVFRESAGTTWADAVLHKSTDTTAWKRAAVSPGGSTI
jgi:hypothetical protein